MRRLVIVWSACSAVRGCAERLRFFGGTLSYLGMRIAVTVDGSAKSVRVICRDSSSLACGRACPFASSVAGEDGNPDQNGRSDLEQFRRNGPRRSGRGGCRHP